MTTHRIESVLLSQCGAWTTTDGTTHGPLAEVRCPDVAAERCTGLAPYTSTGRIGDHIHTGPGRCRWVGSPVLDDRHTTARRRLRVVDGVIELDAEAVNHA
ncbi:hypothetical protein [Amycolatopsis sp. NPDC051716]|uniref:hypothetical protein n=1 Tax=Actinomycetes TaxID=1760 RepID=UPI00342FD6FD